MIDRCPHCRSPRLYFDNTPSDRYVCGESDVTGKDADRTAACLYIRDLIDELHDQNLCFLDPIFEDPQNNSSKILSYRHNFTSHEEDACIFLAKMFPDEYELIPGGINVVERKG